MSIESPEPQASEPKLIEMPDWDKLAQSRELSDTPEANKEDVEPFAVGEAVSVSRTKGGIDHIGWIVKSSNPDFTIVVNPEKRLEKEVDTSALHALQDKLDEQIERDLGYNPKEAARTKMADRAFSVVGPDKPTVVESAVDVDKVFDSKQSVRPVESADTPTQPQGESLSAKAELARLKEELDAFEASLPAEDRVPAWRYSTALYENEKENAIRKMSTATRDSKAYIKYDSLYRRYNNALSNAR